jgi:dihydrolipoamide dehydrogenase
VGGALPEALVVGAGVAGYTLSTLLAKAGWSVKVFEEKLVGGECTNYGCAPAKALLSYAKVVEDARRHGVAANGDAVELLSRGLDYARRVAAEERAGIEELLKRAGVELVRGRAFVELVGSRPRVRVGSETFTADVVAIATGSEPYVPEWVERCDRVLDNRSLFELERLEGELIAVVGGGFVGVELSQAFARLGFRVEVYEALPSLLPGFDRDLSSIARRLLARLGVSVYTSTPVEKVKCGSGRAEVYVRGTRRAYDYVVVALGRRPRVAELRGVPLSSRGFVRVDDSLAVPNAKGLYALGDVAGPPMLAHKAIADALTVFRRLTGRRAPRPRVIPQVVYGDPELVQVEHPDLRRARTRVVRFPWGYNLVVKVKGVTASLVMAKLVYEERTGRLLAAYVAGPNASEIAGYLAHAIEHGHTVEQLRGELHPHPSAIESVWEAVLHAVGESFNRV